MLGVFDIQCSFFSGLNSRQKRNSNKVKFENRCSLTTHMQVNGCEVTEKRQITRLLCMKKQNLISSKFGKEYQVSRKA